eukprot:CAMPEP_0195295454 /NCGR_PEP_ID=MMETSP0707-20130614/17432_1 /TAXON_ID=33640 /ORGANISM="Asterionellopsis glacialis, Strain CCMP134" /LENGTH=292 /DNA_ID=CAMNT_0040356689 /DNA_START=40 /DNA_END=918 /DNA_ORIENTATION=-
MSSLRNAVKRIAHKERSQPQARQHLGILEKKKDYRVRARDFHNKEDRIKSMKTKASQRNPDEFYFGMRKAEVRDGHHRKTREAQQEDLDHIIGPEAVRIMKDQDLTYVRMLKQKDAKKIERLQSSLHFLGGEDENSNEYDESSRKKKKRKHTIFVQTKKDVETFDVAEHFDTVPEMADRAFNRPRLSTLRDAAMSGLGDKDDDEDGNDYKLTEKQLELQAKAARRTAKKVAKARSSAYGEMEARTKRLEVMARAEERLVLEKNLAGKGRKRKVKGGEDGKPAVYKWRRKRLR